MSGLLTDDGPRPLCHFTHSSIPSFVNHAQPPTKKRPFSTVTKQESSHALELLLPESAVPEFEKNLRGNTAAAGQVYARVYMKPSELLEGDFFNTYIKAGNILMLSEISPYGDTTLSLSQGVLRIHTDTPTYERMGLQGTPIPSSGRKHIKARYAIELNLRLPSMLHGKKGFERIVWAFKNVLDHSLAWLFSDLEDPRLESAGPIDSFAPARRPLQPQTSRLEGVLVPMFPAEFTHDSYGEEASAELLEWLTLTLAESPRLQQDDRIDAYLCRYSVPSLAATDSPPAAETLVKLRWRGLLSNTYIIKILLLALKACDKQWFALSATSFDGQSYTILQNGDATMTWEYTD